MKKQKKGLLAAIVVLVLLIGVYLALRAAAPEEDQPASTEADTKTAFEIKAEDISELSIENGKESYHFSRKEDKWTYTEDENFPLSESQIQNVVSNLTSISAVRELENTENLADYGLDNPEIQVTVTDIEGKETELKFGDINDAVSGCYMSKSGSHKVYLVDSSVKTGLEVKLTDLAEKEEIPSIAASSVKKVEINRNNETQTLGEEKSSETGWSYKDSDGRIIAADSSKTGEYMNQYSTVAWNDFVAYDTDNLAEYGLDNPTKVTIDYQVTESVPEEKAKDTEEGEKADSGENGSEKDEHAQGETEAVKEVTVDKQVVFLIGKQDTEGNYYAKLQDGKYVYTLLQSTVESMLNINPEELVSSLVSDYSFADLDKVTFVRNEQTYAAVKKEVEKEKSPKGKNSEEEDAEPETETKYYLNDKEIDKNLFTTFFSTVTSMEWQEQIKNAQVQGTPEMMITFEKEGGIQNTVEYYPYDTNFYLEKDTKGNETLVNKMKVKEMLDSFDSMIKKWEKGKE